MPGFLRWMIPHRNAPSLDGPFTLQVLYEIAWVGPPPCACILNTEPICFKCSPTDGKDIIRGVMGVIPAVKSKDGNGILESKSYDCFEKVRATLLQGSYDDGFICSSGGVVSQRVACPCLLTNCQLSNVASPTTVLKSGSGTQKLRFTMAMKTNQNPEFTNPCLPNQGCV